VAAPRHPTDADRERAAAPVLERYRAAVGAGDPAALRAVLADGCVWLAEDGQMEGPDAAVAHHAALRARWPAGARVEWTRVQPHGAHAVLGWRVLDGDRELAQGLVVLEVRREAIVFGAEAVAAA
jgi:ketosteroid isomerase-like protein